MERQSSERTKSPVRDNLLPLSSRASINSDSDDSGFAPSEELVFTCAEDDKAGLSVKFPERNRRFSSVCSVSDHYREISIPEVVVTSHDDEDSTSTEAKPSHSDNRRTLMRSLSSPDGMMTNIASSSNEVERNDFRNDDFVVTLEDVEKFKVMRKKSGGSGGSNFDERLTDFNVPNVKFDVTG